MTLRFRDAAGCFTSGYAALFCAALTLLIAALLSLCCFSPRQRLLLFREASAIFRQPPLICFFESGERRYADAGWLPLKIAMLPPMMLPLRQSLPARRYAASALPCHLIDTLPRLAFA